MGIDAKQVQALIDKPGVTPDELVQMMRDLTSPLIPFFSKNKSVISESEKEEDDRIEKYQSWIDSWRGSKGDAQQYNDMALVGKSLLAEIAENHLGIKLFVTSSGSGGNAATTGNNAEDLTIYAKSVADSENQAIKDVAKDAARFVADAGSGISDLLLKAAIAYFIIQALERVGTKKVLA